MLHVLHGATVTDGAVAAVRPLLVARTEAAVDAGAAQTAAAGQAGLKRVDVIEYFQSGSTVGYSANIERLRLRVAAMLSQTYSPMMAAGTSELGRG